MNFTLQDATPSQTMVHSNDFNRYITPFRLIMLATLPPPPPSPAPPPPPPPPLLLLFLLLLLLLHHHHHHHHVTCSQSRVGSQRLHGKLRHVRQIHQVSTTSHTPKTQTLNPISSNILPPSSASSQRRLWLARWRHRQALLLPNPIFSHSPPQPRCMLSTFYQRAEEYAYPFPQCIFVTYCRFSSEKLLTRT